MATRGSRITWFRTQGGPSDRVREGRPRLNEEESHKSIRRVSDGVTAKKRSIVTPLGICTSLQPNARSEGGVGVNRDMTGPGGETNEASPDDQAEVHFGLVISRQ
jgi:hypothetical protein